MAIGLLATACAGESLEDASTIRFHIRNETSKEVLLREQQGQGGIWLHLDPYRGGQTFLPKDTTTSAFRGFCDDPDPEAFESIPPPAVAIEPGDTFVYEWQTVEFSGTTELGDELDLLDATDPAYCVNVRRVPRGSYDANIMVAYVQDGEIVSGSVTVPIIVDARDRTVEVAITEEDFVTP